MRDIMFDIPTKEEIAKVVVNEATVKDKKPELILAEDGKRTPIKIAKKGRNKKGIESA
jgi:ATP-dependent Clp protease ATP-binding subunit ClpX